jgi:hypothetical protein
MRLLAGWQAAHCENASRKREEEKLEEVGNGRIGNGRSLREEMQ